MQNNFNYQDILKPEQVAKLKSLDLKAKAVVEGFMVGYHKSPYHGFSIEFSQHRPYMQGDSIKNLDWKVFAKSEKYFIKQYEEETNLIANIVLDTSKSMDYAGEGRISKFEYSRILAASLSYLLLKQQDSVGLALFSDEIKNYLRPKSKRAYLKQILFELHKTVPNSTTNISECIGSFVQHLKRRGLVIIISDFLDSPDKILNSLKKLYHKKNEVIVFHILDPLEKNFDFHKDAIFVDVETREQMNTQPIQIQKAYIDSFKEYLETIRIGCEKINFDYNLIDNSTNFDIALMSFFRKRAKMI